MTGLIQEILQEPEFERLQYWYNIGPVQRATLEEFADRIVAAQQAQRVAAIMSDPDTARAMDQHYERKWAHRFD